MSEQPKYPPVNPNPLYVAFLVRCWREDEQVRLVLENVATREREGFDSFEALVARLQELFSDEKS